MHKIVEFVMMQLLEKMGGLRVPREIDVCFSKSYPYTKGLRNKSFLYLDQLTIVFGRDRATGEAAK